MAEIRPFRGLRYTGEAESLDRNVAPPYDVLKPEERDALAAKSEHNVVRLTLPEAREDDRSKFVKYARSAALLSEWRQAGALKPESEPAFYRYTQIFDVPSLGRKAVKRTSLIALIKTEPYAKGVVLPHEETFPKHKEDRLRILEATRAHLECIFGLYEDPTGDIHRAVTDATASGSIRVDTPDDGTRHQLEPITDPKTCAQLAEYIADRKVWIADGHHRYETAVTFRQNLGDQETPVAEDYMMMALTSMSDPGLVLLPTHRILNKAKLTGDQMLAKLEPYFYVENVRAGKLFAELQTRQDDGGINFAMVLPDASLLLVAKNPAEILAKEGDAGSPELKRLEVSILHRAILESILGIEGTEGLSYTRNAQEAIDAPQNGAVASFLMNPPTVEDMRTIALGGEKMPQKSTYYFPKILSGLVLWSLNDF